MVSQETFPISAQIIAFSLLAALIPTLFFVGIVYWVDRYEKEPMWLLSATFLWGAIPSILAAFILNAILTLAPYYYLGLEVDEVVATSFVAPIIEESLKGLALVGILLFWHHELDSPLDGIIYGAMVGLGFAMVENVYYFISVYSEGGAQAWGLNIFLRGVIFGLNHALFTALFGLGIAVARLSPRSSVRFIAPVLGWLGAVFLHFMHNATASRGGILLLVTLLNAWGGVLLMIVIIIWALVQERRWIRKYLAEEVELGTLTATQYQVAFSGWKRFSHSFSLLLAEGPSAYLNAARFYRRCSELAYKKHHFATLRDSKSNSLTDKMRADIAQLSELIG